MTLRQRPRSTPWLNDSQIQQAHPCHFVEDADDVADDQHDGEHEVLAELQPAISQEVFA